MITKDRDFVDSHLLSGKPARLLWITTGNISNSRLLQLIDSNLPTLLHEFASANFIELTATNVLIHR